MGRHSNALDNRSYPPRSVAIGFRCGTDRWWAHSPVAGCRGDRDYFSAAQRATCLAHPLTGAADDRQSVRFVVVSGRPTSPPARQSSRGIASGRSGTRAGDLGPVTDHD